tara:strand:+ start:15223 stop:16236 length:1014 start_codon:yes stop_codon:yes gene_type:complete
VIKKLIVSTLGTGPVADLGNWLYRHYVPVFMLHRFTSEETGVKGHDPNFLRDSLEFLRKNGFNFVTIDDVARAIHNKNLLPAKSVAFTLDDGYSDQVAISSDIFAAFDCPATYYVSTGFIRNELWYWDDKIHYLVENCDAKQLAQLQSYFTHLPLPGRCQEDIASLIVEEATSHTLANIESEIYSVASSLDIEIPQEPPQKYKPASWDSLRQIETRGMMVGAHSYSHPILSRETDENAEYEITRSTNDVKENMSNPSSVFCYPIGRRQDFANREIELVKKLGYKAGVSSVPSAVDLRVPADLYSLPRFSFPETNEDFIQYASWIESFKNQLRRPFVK